MSDASKTYPMGYSSRKVTEEVRFRLPAEDLPVVNFRFGSFVPSYGVVRRTEDSYGSNTAITLEVFQNGYRHTATFFNEEIEEIPEGLRESILALLKSKLAPENGN